MACLGEGVQAAGLARRPAILVVEDELFVRLLIADELRAAGYQVMEAVNAEEALAILRSGTVVDVVFTDVRMPGAIDGIALAQAIRCEHPSTYVVLTSGHLPSIEDIDHDGYITKPYDVAQVIMAIRSLIGEGGHERDGRQTRPA